jgi:hypothetical protein
LSTMPSISALFFREIVVTVTIIACKDRLHDINPVSAFPFLKAA